MAFAQRRFADMTVGERPRAPARNDVQKCGGGDWPMKLNFRAAVLTGPNETPRIEAVEAEPPRTGEVLVRIAAAGLCHTDPEVTEGQPVYPTPIVLGRKATGTIAAVGPQRRSRPGRPETGPAIQSVIVFGGAA
jgi:hypothetical protein